jgi:hypothetical protein
MGVGHVTVLKDSSLEGVGIEVAVGAGVVRDQALHGLDANLRAAVRMRVCH